MDHKQAREYGTTTGRKRRIGWFDSVLVRSAVSLNAMRWMALTKLDILDTLETIKIGIAYKLEGKVLHHVPAIAQDWAKIEPIYESMPGWKTSTRGITSYDDLPVQAKNYLKRIEEICQIPVSMISLGPERHETIVIKNPFET